MMNRIPVVVSQEHYALDMAGLGNGLSDKSSSFHIEPDGIDFLSDRKRQRMRFQVHSL